MEEVNISKLSVTLGEVGFALAMGPVVVLVASLLSGSIGQLGLWAAGVVTSIAGFIAWYMHKNSA